MADPDRYVVSGYLELPGGTVECLAGMEYDEDLPRRGLVTIPRALKAAPEIVLQMSPRYLIKTLIVRLRVLKKRWCCRRTATMAVSLLKQVVLRVGRPEMENRQPAQSMLDALAAEYSEKRENGAQAHRGESASVLH